MINIFCKSMFFPGQPFKVSPRRLTAPGLKSCSEYSVPFTGLLHFGAGPNSACGIGSNIFDTKIQSEDFFSRLYRVLNIINSDYQIKSICRAVINKVRLSGIGKFDSIKFLKLILTKGHRYFNPLVPESEFDRVLAAEGTDTVIKRDSRGFFKPVHFLFLSFIRTRDYG